MKKIFTTLFATAALVLGVQAQTVKNLKIHFADGTTKSHKVTVVDSITFEDAVDYSDLTFDIQVSNVTATSATTSVTASRADALYYDNVVLASYLEPTSLGSAEAVAQALLESILSEWEAYKEYYPDLTFADAYLYAGSKVDTYTYTTLDPETEYVSIAFGVDPITLEIVGTVAAKTFTTEAAAPVEESDLTISFTETDGILHITPSNDTETYYWGEFDKEDVEEFGAEALVKDYIEFMVGLGYWDEESLTSGADEVDIMDWFGYYEKPGTWIVCAAGCDALGRLTTEVFTYEVTLTEEDFAGGAARVKAKVRQAIKDQQRQGTLKQVKLQAKKVALKK